MAPEPTIPVDLAPEARTSGRRRSQSGGPLLLAQGTSRASSRSSTSGLRARLGLLGVARRTLGISLLLLTVFLWTLSNFLASEIFSDDTYSKPFFVVYVNTSMFAISLIPMSVQYVWSHGIAATRQRLVEFVRGSLTGGLSSPAKVEEGDATDDEAVEPLLVDDVGSLEAANLAGPADTAEKLSLRETARLSLEFCMLWFFANYFASACLEYTSVGSATILTSTSSVWTLLFCAVTRVDRFSVRKLAGVMASLAGVVLISTVDLSGSSDDNRGNFPHKTTGEMAIGDAMAFVSAIIYGLYVTVMKSRVGNEDRVNMPLFFGLVGLFNVVFLWPGFFILQWTGIETFALPSTAKVWWIILLNSLSSFVSDMAWAYAMLLTTPLIVTVGLSLTIPLSLIGEMIQYAQYSSWVYWVGAGIVLLSFLFINYESAEDAHEEEGKGAVASRATDAADIA